MGAEQTTPETVGFTPEELARFRSLSGASSPSSSRDETVGFTPDELTKFRALSPVASAGSLIRDPVMDDGDSGHGDGAKRRRFRVLGMNTPEVDHGLNSYRVDTNPDGQLSADAVQYQVDNGANFYGTGSSGAKGRELAQFRGAEGKDLSTDMVRSGLAFASRGDASGDAEASGIMLSAFGHGTGNEAIDAFAAQRSSEYFDPLSGNVEFNPSTYDRRGAFSRAFSRGTSDTKAALGGAINYAGDLLGIKDWTASGKEMSRIAALDSAYNPRSIQSYKDVHSLSDSFTYIAEGAGEMAPGLILDAVAAAVTLGTGGLALSAARKAGVTALKMSAEKGIISGAALSGFTQSLGNMENTLEKGGSEINTGASLASGIVGGAVNAIPLGLVFPKLAHAAGVGDKAIVGVTKRLADMRNTITTGALAEGGTNAVQMLVDEVIKHEALNQDTWDLKTVDFIDGTIRAVLGGGIASGGGSIAAHAGQKIRQEYNRHAKSAADGAYNKGTKGWVFEKDLAKEQSDKVSGDTPDLAVGDVVADAPNYGDQDTQGFASEITSDNVSELSSQVYTAVESLVTNPDGTVKSWAEISRPRSEGGILGGTIKFEDGTSQEITDTVLSQYAASAFQGKDTPLYSKSEGPGEVKSRRGLLAGGLVRSLRDLILDKGDSSHLVSDKQRDYLVTQPDFLPELGAAIKAGGEVMSDFISKYKLSKITSLAYLQSFNPDGRRIWRAKFEREEKGRSDIPSVSTGGNEISTDLGAGFRPDPTPAENSTSSSPDSISSRSKKAKESDANARKAKTDASYAALAKMSGGDKLKFLIALSSHAVEKVGRLAKAARATLKQITLLSSDTGNAATDRTNMDTLRSMAVRLEVPNADTATADQIRDHVLNTALFSINTRLSSDASVLDSARTGLSSTEVVNRSVRDAVSSGDEAAVRQLMDEHDLSESDVRNISKGHVAAEPPDAGNAPIDGSDPFDDPTEVDLNANPNISVVDNLGDHGSISSREELAVNRSRRRSFASQVIDVIANVPMFKDVDLKPLLALLQQDTAVEKTLQLTEADSPKVDATIPFHIETPDGSGAPQTSGKGGRTKKTIPMDEPFLTRLKSMVEAGDLEGAKKLLERKQVIGDEAHIGDNPAANDTVRVLAFINKAFKALKSAVANDSEAKVKRGYIAVNVTYPDGTKAVRYIKAHDITKFGAAQLESQGFSLDAVDGNSSANFGKMLSIAFHSGLSRLVNSGDSGFSFSVDMNTKLPNDLIVYETDSGRGYSLKSVRESENASTGFDPINSTSPLDSRESGALKAYIKDISESLRVLRAGGPAGSSLREVSSAFARKSLARAKYLRDRLLLANRLRIVNKMSSDGDFAGLRRLLNTVDTEHAARADYLAESASNFEHHETADRGDHANDSANDAADSLITPRRNTRNSARDSGAKPDNSPYKAAREADAVAKLQEELAVADATDSSLSASDLAHNAPILAKRSELEQRIASLDELLFETVSSNGMMDVFKLGTKARESLSRGLATLRKRRAALTADLRHPPKAKSNTLHKPSSAHASSSPDVSVKPQVVSERTRSAISAAESARDKLLSIVSGLRDKLASISSAVSLEYAPAITRASREVARRKADPSHDAASVKAAEDVLSSLHEKRKGEIVRAQSSLHSEIDGHLAHIAEHTNSIASLSPKSVLSDPASDHAPATIGGHDVELPDGHSLSRGRSVQANRQLRSAAKPNAVFRVVSKLFDSMRTRIERFNYTLAEALMTRSGDGNLDGSFERDSRLMYENYLVKLDSLFDSAPHRKGQVLHAAYEDAQSGSPATPNGKKLLAFIDSFHEQLSLHNPHYKETGIPVTLDVAAIDRNRDGFLEILRKHGVEDSFDIMERIVNSNGVLASHIDLAGVGSPAGTRKINTQLRKAMSDLREAGLVDSDAATSLDRFFASGSKFAHWSRIFGMTSKDGKFNPSGFYDHLLRNTAPEHLGEVRSMVNTILGRTPPVPSWVNKLNSVSFAFQAATVLLFSGSSSIPELATVIGRSRGDIDSMYSEFKKLATVSGRENLNGLARAYETASISVNRHALGNLFGAGEATVGKFSRGISETMFKYNGQNYITHYTRAFATSMGRAYIMEHLNKALLKGDLIAIDALKELGLTTSDLAAIKRAEHEHGLDHIDLNSGAGLKLKMAVSRFVDESVSNPHHSQMPRWMSDPRYQIVASLKKFMYALWDNGHRQGYSAYQKGVKQGRGQGRAALPLALMMATALPLAAVAELIREEVKYPLGRPNGSPRSLFDWMQSVTNATGMLGPMQAAQASYEQMGYGRNFFVSAAGPTASLGVDLLTGKSRVSRFVPFASQVPWAGKPLNSGSRSFYKWVAYDD